MAGPVSGFRSQAARDAYCKRYDEAIALSRVPVEESDVNTSFGTTHVLTAGDPTKPALVVDIMSGCSTRWANSTRRAAFVAESLGTWMSTHYAMARPQRVERLALLVPAGIASRQQLPHARVVLVDDANHIVLIYQTEIVEQELQKFLATRSRA
jgi:hypothetical protein